MDTKITLGVIVGNRGFFPDHLCDTGRKEILEVLEKLGFNTVILDDTETSFGAVETIDEARKCADLFRRNSDRIDGILVTLPNFGDERAIANTIRWSELKAPILVHAFSDDSEHMTIKHRRDAFCGKMSACNCLRQYDIPFTLTSLHTVSPGHPEFARDLNDFSVTCRAVKALKNLRVGALGARPAPFNTVRFSEKLLERAGISVETLDLSEVFGKANGLSDTDPQVKSKLNAILNYANAKTIPDAAVMKMAKFGVVVDNWIQETNLQATAVQCWTSMEEFFGVVPCTLMSMLSNIGLSSACEVDVMGAIAMHTLSKAGRRPSALVDWNNNYGDDPDKGVIFHCSNIAKDLFAGESEDKPQMDFQEIIAGAVGKENTYGTIVGRLKATPFTCLRIGTDDSSGRIKAYISEGTLTKDPLNTFGGYGVVHIPNFQKLLAHICENGFEHHVAVNPTTTARGVKEALTKYLGWDLYHHA
ncbi:MAG: L-fucose/L-arabinose isomerase family protein [Verrucomicrobia bacterium]|nr:L-fucose/L-arabinose isomerase family protein [Verrucomicrobiota bacterium]